MYRLQRLPVSRLQKNSLTTFKHFIKPYSFVALHYAAGKKFVVREFRVFAPYFVFLEGRRYDFLRRRPNLETMIEFYFFLLFATVVRNISIYLY